MPLIHSKSPGAFKTNVRTLMHDVGKSPHVQSRKQALAIAYSTARRAAKKYAAGGYIHKDDGGGLDDMPPLHREYLARRGVETASPDLSPTATAADLKGEALGMADQPFGLPSYAAGQISPALGQRLQAIKEASPEGYGAGALLSPVNDISGALMGKGIGMLQRGARAAPKTAAAIGTAGLTAAGTSMAGENEPAPSTIDENDPELQKRLSALGPKPALQKEQQQQIDALNTKIDAESKLQATAERRIPQGDKEKDADYAKRKAADPRVSVHANKIADLRDQIKGIGGQVLTDQATWSKSVAEIHKTYADEQAELQRKQAPFATREPGQQAWFDRAPLLSLGTGYLAGRGLNALSKGAVTGKKLASTVGLAGLAGFGESLYGAGEPARQDFLMPRGSGARKQLDENVKDPGWWASKGLEIGEGTLGGTLGAYYGAKGPITRMISPTAHEAATTAVRRLFKLPVDAAPAAAPAAAAPAVQQAVTRTARKYQYPTDANGKRVWPARIDDLTDLKQDTAGRWRSHGHPLPDHLNTQAEQRAAASAPPAPNTPTPAQGGSVGNPYSRGGYAPGGLTSPFETRMAARGLLHEGQINSVVPGRTDKLPITVGGGAYVLPADHMAAIGQGNSMAGANIMNKMLKLGPYGSAMGSMRPMRPTIPHLNLRPHAAGGVAGHKSGVDIIAAGGEYVIPPEKVQEIGGGDMDRGHKILDHWVVSTRKQHISTLRGLKPPKKN